MGLKKPNRRTVLKGLGAGVGGMTLTGTATAGEHDDEDRKPPKRGQHHSYAWANGVEWDMLESEPPGGGDGEGAEPAHRPLWVIAATGMCNSPHPAPVPGIDHVIPLGPGGIYTAQWHVHLVTEEGTTPGDLQEPPIPFENQDGSGNFLLSADAIKAAEDAGEIEVFETPTVFTCPARPGSCTQS